MERKTTKHTSTKIEVDSDFLDMIGRHMQGIIKKMQELEERQTELDLAFKRKAHQEELGDERIHAFLQKIMANR